MQGLPAPAYAYALNNPLKYVDRNGLDPWGEVAGGFWGGLGWMLGGTLSINSAGSGHWWGTNYFWEIDNHPLMNPGVSITLGHTVCSGSIPTKETLRHEVQHIHQGDVMDLCGPIPCYLLFHGEEQLRASLSGHAYDWGNLGEEGPYGKPDAYAPPYAPTNGPPRPWPWQTAFP